MSLALENKVAVVTGGAQGLGEALCQRLAREGARVAVADVNEAGAQRTASSVKGLGLKVDVTQEAEVKALFERTQAEFGRVDIVVANAAILIAEPIAEARRGEVARGDERQPLRQLPHNEARLPDHEGSGRRLHRPD